ncbi:MAG: hypothetical protein ACHP7I_05040 [Terriglobales bacterium]
MKKGIMTKLRAGGKNYWQQDFRSALLPVAAEQLLEARVGSNHSGPLIRGGSSYSQVDQAQNSRVAADLAEMGELGWGFRLSGGAGL